ncbi:MAG: nitroreductase family deazaflavin-dependent oxidoreductase [Solirubrobacterales bacterium]
MRVPDAPQSDSPFWKFWNVGTRLHTAAYKLSHGRIGGTSAGAPVALVEHVGRRSGKHRTSPLICQPDGENLVVIASKGGVEKHPAWYHNLMADPETDAWWEGRKRRVRARVAEGEERERLWEKMVAVYGPYKHYQRRTERQIPVVVLEPAG